MPRGNHYSHPVVGLEMRCKFTRIGTDEGTGKEVYTCERVTSGCMNRYVLSSHPPESVYAKCTADGSEVNTPATIETFKRERCSVTPSVLKRVLSYKKALTKWRRAGSPSRTDEEVKKIYEEHCSSCACLKKSAYGEWCSCCGCGIKKAGGVMNKLHFATEGCPLDVPKFAPKVEVEKS